VSNVVSLTRAELLFFVWPLSLFVVMRVFFHWVSRLHVNSGLSDLVDMMASTLLSALHLSECIQVGHLESLTNGITFLN
jgi:hypothetical protein